jgi:hypothetical protein
MATRWGERLRARLSGETAVALPLRPRGGPRPEVEPAPEQPPAWRLVLRALAEASGFDRGLFYDVPRAEAPRPLPGTRVFLRGSPAWRRFLALRERLDDGTLTPILSLRPLDDRERRHAVDWGASYANAFLLVEPLDPDCDLADPADPRRRALEAAAKTLLRRHTPEGASETPWTRDTPLGAVARSLYGAWIAWPPPNSGGAPERVPLSFAAPDETLCDKLQAALAARYPEEQFDAALADLYEREHELFGGPVARARIPFLTRLGLPVPVEPYRVDYALRRMVNEGRAWVFEEGPDPAFYHGPGRAVPERMTDAEFERLIVR